MRTSEDEIYQPDEQEAEAPRNPANAPETPKYGTSEPAAEGLRSHTQETTAKNPEEATSNEEDEEDSKKQ